MARAGVPAGTSPAVPDAQADVEAAANEIDHRIGEMQVDRHGRVLAQKLRQQRRDAGHYPEGHRRGKPNDARGSEAAALARASAASPSARMRVASSRAAWPASVRASLREVRWNSRAPRRTSNQPTAFGARALEQAEVAQRQPGRTSPSRRPWRRWPKPRNRAVALKASWKR